MTLAIMSPNNVNVTYPDIQVELGDDQGQVLYFLAGSLLSSALTRAKRDSRLGTTFCPFVDRHKVGVL